MKVGVDNTIKKWKIAIPALANIGHQKSVVNAETAPLRDPERYQYNLHLPDIAEVWRRGSVIASWAPRFDRSSTRRGSGTFEVRLARLGFGRGALDNQRRH